jgi:hypothetical protein
MPSDGFSKSLASAICGGRSSHCSGGHPCEFQKLYIDLILVRTFESRLFRGLKKSDFCRVVGLPGLAVRKAWPAGPRSEGSCSALSRENVGRLFLLLQYRP